MRSRYAKGLNTDLFKPPTPPHRTSPPTPAPSVVPRDLQYEPSNPWMWDGNAGNS